MLKKSFTLILILGFVFSSVLIIKAQEKSSEKKDKQTQAQSEDMQKCMDKIASDNHMREMMMQKMMDHTKGNKEGMMQMCKKMMDNPDMHKMMMEMIGGKMMEHEGMMKHDMMNADHDKMDMKKDNIVREGEVDLRAIDKNKDGKVFQDPMDWNVISDKPGKCPICEMTLKEVTLNQAKQNLIKNGFKVK
ncbi:MAG: hypothetical protein KJ666_18540 [Bacteroidetes bacterium]|nr:hypothetical protein [Bacteroidota bacterium]MBU2584185.1 hypothetical protein [Bacteroidota bacterium]